MASDFQKFESVVNAFGIGPSQIVKRMLDPIEGRLIENGVCSGALVVPQGTFKGWKQYFRIMWQTDSELIKRVAQEYCKARHGATDCQFFVAHSSVKLGTVHFYALFTAGRE